VGALMETKCSIDTPDFMAWPTKRMANDRVKLSFIVFKLPDDSSNFYQIRFPSWRITVGRQVKQDNPMTFIKQPSGYGRETAGRTFPAVYKQYDRPRAC